MSQAVERLRGVGLKATGPRVMLLAAASRIVVTRRLSNCTKTCGSLILRYPCRQCIRRWMRLSAPGCVDGFLTLEIVCGLMARPKS